ncbi:MAG: type VI secretion system protein TssL, long form, partial [Zoogloeaceae bacterium]|nr:type VI secretion system protein TssL, long form [Zoogloeaceae bacterium]
YPEHHRHLIELLYYCNALGFEGKFRVTENGHAQLEIVKRRIATLLNTVRNGYEHRLSPNWKGEEAKQEPWRIIPPWVVALSCALLALAIYVWLSFLLEPDSDKVFRRLVSLETPSPLVERPVAPRLRHFLEPEIRAGLLEVRDLSDRSIITLMGDGLFESGRTEVRLNYLDVLGRIARGLDEIDGKVVVTGYTDNVPMRSARFPSNWHLSEARARTVAKLLSGRMQRHSQVRAEGRGEAEPLAANDTPEGRARNRRVEITLMLSGEEIHRQRDPDAAVREREVR